MWDTLIKILNIPLGIGALYLYIENRKLRGFEIDKEIELKEIEIESLKRENPLSEGNTFSGFEYASQSSSQNFEKRNHEYADNMKKLGAQLEYLKRLKKYRWIFSK